MFAYATLVFGGDNYITGAIVLAKSIKLLRKNDGTDPVIVCMITNDVSSDGRKKLMEYFDEVVDVKYLTMNTIPLKTEKQSKMYHWMSKSFTKWNCLTLTKYSKVLFCDADIIFIKNCDELFELNTPAGIFSSPWCSYYIDNKNYFKDGWTNKIPHPYLVEVEHKKKKLIREPLHGELISSDKILKSLDNSFVINGSMVLLKPSINHFGLFQRWLIGQNIYGHNGLSGFDCQAICEFYIKELKKEWTNIHQIYNWCPRKFDWITNPSLAYSYHYIGTKPWEHAEGEWEDMNKWWEINNDSRLV